LDKKTLQETNSEDLREEMINHIKTSDVEISHYKKFVGKNIVSGMQNFIWICPNCNAKEELEFAGDKIFCQKCETDFLFNANLWLVNPNKNVRNLHNWVKMQKNFVKNAMKNEILCENEKVCLIQNDYGGRITILDCGKLQISKEKLEFFGDSAKIEIPVNEIIAPVFQQKNIIQFEYQKGELKFQFPESPMMKHLFFLRELTGFAEVEKRGYFV
jgi:hypothetical protein